MNKILILDTDSNLFTELVVNERDGKLYAQEEGHPEFQILPEVADPEEQAKLAELYLKGVVETGEDYLNRIPDAAGKTPDEIRILSARILGDN